MSNSGRTRTVSDEDIGSRVQLEAIAVWCVRGEYFPGNSGAVQERRWRGVPRMQTLGTSRARGGRSSDRLFSSVGLHRLPSHVPAQCQFDVF
jgi:hypothetical protein